MDSERMTPVSMFLPSSTLARLDQAAAKELRSRSSMARTLLDRALRYYNRGRAGHLIQLHRLSLEHVLLG